MRSLLVWPVFLVVALVACDNGDKNPPSPTDPEPAPLPTGDDWVSQRTMYQLAVRSFFDSDGNGQGDLAGVTQKLDYLADLRVGTVLLDPILPTSFRDGNRAASDFTGIAPELGDLEAFSALVAAAHDADLKLIVTLPLNQTDTFHPWFTAALADTSAEAGEWYVFASAATVCDDVPPAEPNVYGDVRWSEVVSGSVYYHRFAASSPDLNFTHAPVVAAVKEALKFWLDQGVDGIYIPDAYAWVEDGGDCENTAASRALLQEMRGVLADYPQTALLAADRYSSGLLNDSADRVAGYAADGGANLVLDAEPTIYLHGIGDDSFPASDFVDYLTALRQRLSVAGGDVLTPSSHPDRPRAAASLGNNLQLYRLFLAVQFSLPATPLLLYGDELGVGAAGSYVVDIRDLGTPPMPWTATAPTYGFSSAESWLESPLGADLRNVQMAINDEGSIYTFARKLIDLRNAYPTLRSADFTALAVADQRSNSPLSDVLAWQRGSGEGAVVVMHNPTQAARDIALDLSGSVWPAGQQLQDLLRPDQAPLLFGGPTSPLLRVTLDPRSSYYLAALTDVSGD